MGSLKLYEIEKIINSSPFEKKEFTIFVETGTHYGNTLKNVLSFFKEIHTIELSENFYNRALNIFNDYKNVKFYLGDSSELLAKIINVLNNPTIFFLDGHFSSEDTAQGKKDVPLIEELISINNSFLHESIIIIDDYRLFGTNFNENWLEITEENILNCLEGRIISFEIKDDRFIIYLKSKNKL